MNFKKFLLIALAPLLLSGCGTSDEQSSDSKDIVTHQYSETYQKDETGHWQICTVEGHTDTSEKEAHKFGEWKTLTEADVHVDKVEHRLCSVCEYEEKRTVSDSGTHTYDTNVWKYDSTHHWHESTCSHTPALKGDVAEHTLTDWKEKTPATYTSDRVDERHCTICDFSETKVVEGSTLSKVVRTLYLKILANRTFDGTEKLVTESDLILDNKEGGLTIEYRKKGVGEFSTTYEPIEAGTYEYRVTLGETEKYTMVQKSAEFVIDKCPLDLPNKTLFDLNTSSMTIHEFSVSSFTNNWTDYVDIKVGDKYSKPGKYKVPTSELTLDEENFTLNVGTTEFINVINADTKDFIAYISGTPELVSGTTNVVNVPIKIAQGTLSQKPKSTYFQGYDWLAVQSAKQNGIDMEKATVGEELTLTVTKPDIDISKLTKGTFLSSKMDLAAYQSAFATVKLYSTEEGGIAPYFGDFIRFITFEDTSTELKVRTTSAAQPGSTYENVRLDFSDKIVNYENRTFKLRTEKDNVVFAEGIITSNHNHTESINTTGKCEDCGFNNSQNLAFAEGSNEVKSYLNRDFKYEVRVYYLDLAQALNQYSKYTFTMTNGSGSSMSGAYTVDVYNALTGDKLSLTSSSYQLDPGKGNRSVKIITKFSNPSSPTLYYTFAQLEVSRTFIAE